MEEFGPLLRQLRTNAGMGIKGLAPELGVSYTYLSKLENSQVRPSEDLVRRVSEYFGYDRDRMLLAAQRVPPDILRILREHPDDALDFLRKQFGDRGG